MKKIFCFSILLLFLVSCVSANIYLEKEPLNLYSLKDKIDIRVKISPEIETNNLVSIFLSCGENKVEVYKEFLVLDSEIIKDISVPLLKEFIGEAKGNCVFEGKIADSVSVISNQFFISNKLIINLDDSGEVLPGENNVFSGTILRENGKAAEGKVEAQILGTNNIFVTQDFSNGDYDLIFSIPEKFEAGEHTLEIYAYEKNKYGQIVNEGSLSKRIFVKQIPKNLEIILDNNGLNPGEVLSGNVFLRDQTGEKMNRDVYIAIKDETGEIVGKIEGKTGEKFEYLLGEDELANTWSVSAYSEELISKSEFNILEYRKLSLDLINQTLSVKNIGNVYYNDSLDVVIGNLTRKIPISLDVGEIEQYKLYAPTGEYEVKFGDTIKIVSLTGRAIDIEKVYESTNSFVKIIVWIFILAILGLVTYSIFTKGYKKTFFGRVSGKKSKKPLDLKEPPKPEKLSQTKVKGELSLSIRGSKQVSPMGCIFLKNYENIKSGKGGVKETLSHIGNIVESYKGILYENESYIFFLLPPAKTKTFKNELPILEITQKIKSLLDEHNRKFKEKINYGISLNIGEIVAKSEKDIFKFMALGTLISLAKKISKFSNGEILISEDFKTKVANEVKVENKNIADTKIFEFKEFAQKKDHSQFIKNFVEKNFK